MNKLGLIISREYITRVKNLKFLLTTLLTPLGFLVFFVAVGFIFSYESGQTYKTVVLNQSGTEMSLPSNTDKFSFSLSTDPLDSLKARYMRGEFDGILVLPKFAGVEVSNYTAYFYSDRALDIEMESTLDKHLSESIRDYKINLLSLDKQQLEKLKTNVSIDPEPVSPYQKDKSAHTGKIATALGGAMGYIIFFIIFLYGASVMRSVTEEKINRIVEVIISSVKPTELMLGKIIGVGLVGLTQIIIWLVLIPVIYIFGLSLAGIQAEDFQQLSQSIPNQGLTDQEEILTIINEIGNLNWWKILPLFVLYFLGGYFIYAAFFAAIGAASGDDINDAQSLTILVTIPILLGMYLMFQAIREPNSSLAMFSSIFPLFSPIVMPAILVFDPPLWQVILSLVLMFLFAYLIVAFAGRIYRIGILMYGKKASIKEIGRWMFTK
ncbi:MAG: ABC transporter permease [Bacteroidota bacterium]|nr:ABC transporter permease [Bacteroidota bacterium]